MSISKQPSAAPSETLIDLDGILALDGAAFIEAAYRSFMGRDPDSAGLSNYLQHLAGGESKMLIAAALYDSKEGRDFRTPDIDAPSIRLGVRIQTLLGMSHADFLIGAYLVLLNRAPDAEGEASYRQHLASGTAKIDVLLALAASEEARLCRSPLPELEAFRPGRKTFWTRATQKALKRLGLGEALRLQEMRVSGLEERLQRLEAKATAPGRGSSARPAATLPTSVPAAEPGQVMDATRLIAFYLPQYHRIKENSEWWGAGFTEWTNVAKGRPNFAGHVQPHLPGELGFYDLSRPDIMYEQTDLARQHGVSGFCFYHYWFSGRRVLETPVNNFMASDIDFPFCICWANENWTKTWDGEENNILLKQEYKEGDDQSFLQSIEATLKDRRYIRVNGAPLLLVYRIKQFPDPVRSIQTWRDEAARLGIPKLYVAVVDFYDISSPDEVGADAIIEFPPHKFIGPENIPDQVPTFTNPDFRGGVVEYRKVASQAIRREQPAYNLIRGIIPGWDNTARRQNTPHTVLGNHPELYREWLSYARRYARATARSADEQMIFVNAWNEWGEGCHLEPDLHWGRQFLEETSKTRWYDPALDAMSLAEHQKSSLARLASAADRLFPKS